LPLRGKRGLANRSRLLSPKRGWADLGGTGWLEGGGGGGGGGVGHGRGEPPWGMDGLGDDLGARRPVDIFQGGTGPRPGGGQGPGGGRGGGWGGFGPTGKKLQLQKPFPLEKGFFRFRLSGGKQVRASLIGGGGREKGGPARFSDEPGGGIGGERVAALSWAF